MLTAEEEKEIEIHLIEYQNLRTEMNNLSRYIVQGIIVYFTALFLFIAYSLRPDLTFNSVQYLENIKADNFRSGLLLTLPILNSIVIFFFLSLLLTFHAEASYCRKVISPRITFLIKTPVLAWEGLVIGRGGKLTIPLIASTVLTYILFFILLELVSIYTLKFSSYLLDRGSLVSFFYYCGCCGVGLSITAFLASAYFYLRDLLS